MDATEVRSQREGEGDNDSGGAQKPLCPRAVDWRRFGLGRTEEEEEEEASKAIRLLSLYNEGPLSPPFSFGHFPLFPDAVP